MHIFLLKFRIILNLLNLLFNIFDIQWINICLLFHQKINIFLLVLLFIIAGHNYLDKLYIYSLKFDEIINISLRFKK